MASGIALPANIEAETKDFYAATFWALVSRAEPKPVFLTADAQWAIEPTSERNRWMA